MTEILMAGCGIKDTPAGAEFIKFDRRNAGSGIINSYAGLYAENLTLTRWNRHKRSD